MRQGCRVTPGGGNPRESATEKSLPWCRAVAFGGSTAMVKRWGKSPPRFWQQERYGKPHPEQCRIGASRGKVCPYAFGRAETSTGTLQPGGPGWQLDRPGNRCGRGMVIHGGTAPGTESGLQAIRANSRNGQQKPGPPASPVPATRPPRARGKPALLRLTLPAPPLKGGLQGFRGATPVSPIWERRLWPNRRRSRSV